MLLWQLAYFLYFISGNICIIVIIFNEMIIIINILFEYIFMVLNLDNYNNPGKSIS